MEPFKFKLDDGRTVEVRESMTDFRTAIICIFDEKGRLIEEVTDKERKYKFLTIARAERYDQIMFPNGHHTTILFDDGTKSVDELTYFDHFRFLDRFFYLFKNPLTGAKIIALDLGKENYVCIDKSNDVARSIGTIMINKKVEHIEDDLDLDPMVVRVAIGVIERIDKKFHTNHPEYSEERLRHIMRRKHYKL